MIRLRMTIAAASFGFAVVLGAPATGQECLHESRAGEIYLSYYEHESEAADVEIAALRRHADEVRALCGP